MRAKIVMCSVIALVVSAQAADKPSTGKLEGVATDPSGAVISNVTVIVHRDWPSEDIQDSHLTTDKTGGFSIDLAPGFYDVAAFAHSLSPSAGKVRIKAGRVTNYKAQLPPDPQIMAEFGDIFRESAPVTKSSKAKP